MEGGWGGGWGWGWGRLGSKLPLICTLQLSAHRPGSFLVTDSPMALSASWKMVIRLGIAWKTQRLLAGCVYAGV